MSRTGEENGALVVLTLGVSCGDCTTALCCHALPSLRVDEDSRSGESGMKLQRQRVAGGEKTECIFYLLRLQSYDIVI